MVPPGAPCVALDHRCAAYMRSCRPPPMTAAAPCYVADMRDRRWMSGCRKVPSNPLDRTSQGDRLASDKRDSQG